MDPLKKDPYRDTFLGKFYYDPSDKRLLVINRYNKRYTLNFANAWSYVIAAVLLFAMVIKALAAFGVIHK